MTLRTLILIRNAMVVAWLLLLCAYLIGCSTGSGTAIATCNTASDSRCVNEHVGSECTTNRSHTCIKTGGSALRPVCDCLDSQGGPVPPDYKFPVDRAGRVMIDTDGNKIPVEERQ